jgi:hypothetical protein
VDVAEDGVVELAGVLQAVSRLAIIKTRIIIPNTIFFTIAFHLLLFTYYKWFVSFSPVIFMTGYMVFLMMSWPELSAGNP